MLAPHPFGQVYIAGVGLGHEPVDDSWSAFDHEYLYFATVPKRVVKGAHVFALGAGRRSAVLGLFEVVKAGANLTSQESVESRQVAVQPADSTARLCPAARSHEYRRGPSATRERRAYPRRRKADGAVPRHELIASRCLSR
jgi:hypothetical protein